MKFRIVLLSTITVVVGATTASAAPSTAAWDEVAHPPAGHGFESTSLDGVWSDGTDVWAVGSTAETDSPPPTTYPWGVRCGDDGCQLLELAEVEPDPDMTRLWLNDVHGTASDDVWAVGAAQLGFGQDGQLPLVEHYDGESWSVADTDHLPAADLQGVAAVAPDDVWAMGCAGVCGGRDQTAVVLHWDGETWTDVSSGLPEAYRSSAGWGQAELATDGSRVFLPIGGDLLVHDGEGWHVALRRGDVTGVGVVGDRVWAVGTKDVDGERHVLAWRERGTRWRALPSAGALADGTPTTVTGDGHGRVWLAGRTSAVSNTSTWLLREWDGERWTRIAAPSDHRPQDMPSYALADLAVDGAGRPWVVGSFNDACGCGTTAVLRRGSAG